MPKEDRYKTVSLKTSDIDAAKERAFDKDAEIRYRIQLEVPVFSKSFFQVAKEFIDFQKGRMEAGEITKHRWRALDSHNRVELGVLLDVGLGASVRNFPIGNI